MCTSLTYSMMVTTVPLHASRQEDLVYKYPLNRWEKDFPLWAILEYLPSLQISLLNSHNHLHVLLPFPTLLLLKWTNLLSDHYKLLIILPLVSMSTIGVVNVDNLPWLFFKMMLLSTRQTQQAPLLQQILINLVNSELPPTQNLTKNASSNQSLNQHFLSLSQHPFMQFMVTLNTPLASNPATFVPLATSILLVATTLHPSSDISSIDPKE